MASPSLRTPPMASSSSYPAPPAIPPRSRSRPSDVFRPKLPLDPFAHLDSLRPWPVSAHALAGLAHTHHRQVILVLGEPSQTDLLPLISAPSLSNSLLLIATHAPNAVPIPQSTLAGTSGPAIRILRLGSPLAVQDSGALRLVSLLERAERVARAWRKESHTHKGSQSRVIQLAEGPDSDFSVQEEYSPPTPSTTREGKRRSSPLNPNAHAHTGSSAPLQRYPSPAPSISSAETSSSVNNSSNNTGKGVFNRFRSSTPGSPASSSVSLVPASRTPKKRSATIKHGKPIPHTRPFDAVLNFLPAGVQEKALLKHAILVTTLSAPFMVVAPGHSGSKHPSPPSSYANNNRASVFSTTSFSSSEVSVNNAAAPRKRFSILRAPSKQQMSVYPASAPSSNADLSSHASAPLFLDRAPGKAHIIHVLPSSSSPQSSASSTLSSSTARPLRSSEKPKLAQGIEQFLLSFSFPLSSSLSSPSSANSSPANSRRNSTSQPASRRASFIPPMNMEAMMSGGGGEREEKPVPYVLAEGVLGHALVSSSSPTSSPTSSLSPNPLSFSPSLYPTAPPTTGTSKQTTVAELLLAGALDVNDAPMFAGSVLGAGAGRAWIGAGGEVVLEGSLRRAGVPEVQRVGAVAGLGLVGSGKEFVDAREVKGKQREGSDGTLKKRPPPSALPTPPESASSIEGGEHDDDDISGEDESGSGSASEVEGEPEELEEEDGRRGRHAVDVHPPHSTSAPTAGYNNTKSNQGRSSSLGPPALPLTVQPVLGRGASGASSSLSHSALSYEHDSAEHAGPERAHTTLGHGLHSEKPRSRVHSTFSFFSSKKRKGIPSELTDGVAQPQPGLKGPSSKRGLRRLWAGKEGKTGVVA